MSVAGPTRQVVFHLFKRARAKPRVQFLLALDFLPFQPLTQTTPQARTTRHRKFKSEAIFPNPFPTQRRNLCLYRPSSTDQNRPASTGPNPVDPSLPKES